VFYLNKRSPNNYRLWCIPAFCSVLLAGCFPDHTRLTTVDKLLAASDGEAGKGLQLEVQASELVVSPAAEIEVSESDPFEEPDHGTYSIWPRIRAGFMIDTHLEHPSVQSELEWYSKHPDYLYRTMQRAEPFIHFILEEVEKRGLPTELVLLPIVESAYQPFAYSHGRAAGIWQFIPSTGRIYGLEQTWWYDGRRDIYASTQAALQYLQSLNKQFDGDWTLALAAYNSGSGTVRRAIRKNEKQGKPTDFWHLKLPKETRAYVPKLMALKELVESPELYEVGLRCIPDAPGFIKVDTKSQIDLALAAELAELDMDTLYSYNPAFNRWATAPEGPHRLLLPYHNAEKFKANLALFPEDQRVQWKRHKIKTGETLSHIAVKYDTSVKELRRINSIKGNNIRAGKHLLIPVASRDQATYRLSSTQRKKALQSTKRDNKTRINHIVQNGESFWTISRKYKVNMHKLARWNGMAVRDPLRKGQKLVVWTDNRGKSVVAGRHKPAHTIRPISYTVRNGDSLYRIANRYSVSIDDLHRWNKIKGKYLQPGQKLKVYVDITEQSEG